MIQSLNIHLRRRFFYLCHLIASAMTRVFILKYYNMGNWCSNICYRKKLWYFVVIWMLYLKYLWAITYKSKKNCHSKIVLDYHRFCIHSLHIKDKKFVRNERLSSRTLFAGIYFVEKQYITILAIHSLNSIIYA